MSADKIVFINIDIKCLYIMSQYIDPSIDFIKSLIKNKDYIICNSCEYDNFSIMCF